MWWKIYFWIYLIVTLIGFFVGFGKVSLESATLADIWTVFLSLLSLLALYSYAFKKKILSPKFWRVFFWSVILILIVSLILDILRIPEPDFLKSNLSPTKAGESFIGFIIGLIFAGLPVYYVIYQLGYNKNLLKPKK